MSLNKDPLKEFKKPKVKPIIIIIIKHRHKNQSYKSKDR